MDQNLLDMLPWYVNGTLSQDERRFVELHLDDERIYRQQLSFYLSLRDEIQQSVQETIPDLGLSKTLNKIRQAQQSANNSTPASEPFNYRLRTWLEAIFGSRDLLRPAFALGIAIVATQTVVIGYLAVERQDNFSEVRARQNAPAGIGPFIKVSFRPDAKESDIRFLMIQLGASIVGGPSQLGDYFLYLKPDRTDWASQQLRKSPIVDSVNVIATLPALKE